MKLSQEIIIFLSNKSETLRLKDFRVEAGAMDFNGIRYVNLVPKPLFESQEASGLQNRFVETKIKLKKLQFIPVTVF